MEIRDEKKNKNRRYEPIIDRVPDWPVYQLSKDRVNFIEEVTEKTFRRLIARKPDRKQLIEELESTALREQNRLKRNRWRVDPKDEPRFWANVRNRLTTLSATPSEDPEPVRAILREIIARYSNEIAGDFRPSRYRIARSIIEFWFVRLLNGARIKKFGAFFRSKYTLRDKIQIVGKVEQLRSLAAKGTVIMVPTHFSNIDSMLIGWVIHSLGLPPFIYGAGLNLFNIKIFAYFMNSLGAYKVDRRKKNVPYLETLKMYSNLALQKGAHSLFFPGGTRSRSGMLEKQLKLGLLSTAIDAQRHIFTEAEESGSDNPRKIFVVPVSLNYHFVLEAPDLIEEYLQSKGKDRYFPEKEKYGSMELLKFIYKFATKGSAISVSIGRGLDVLGNPVNNDGESIDKMGNVIELRDYFISNSRITEDAQREGEYTRMLAEKVVEEYHRINRIFGSHLVAFTAFEMFQRLHPKLDLFGLLRLPEEELAIPYDEFRAAFKKVRKQVYQLKKAGKANHASHVKGKADEVIRRGIENTGIFHLKRPLLTDKAGNIITQDLNLLYYYHNRLVGYGLERFI